MPFDDRYSSRPPPSRPSTSPGFRREEVLCPLTVPREQVPLMTHVRSTLLGSSMNVVRQRDLLDAYLAHLPQSHHQTMLGIIAGVWLPIDVGLAHYQAMDALGFTAEEQFAIGRDVTVKIQQNILGTLVRLSSGVGATPETVGVHFNRLWSRLMLGGAGVVYKVGPKEARVEGLNVPLARIRYFRNAWRGLMAGGGGLFCSRIYVTEIPRYCTADTIGFRVAWA